MLGFELKFRDKILHLPLEAGLIVTRKSTDREEDMYIDVGLYDPFTNNIVNWLREKLQLGNSIEIVIKQIEETETSVLWINMISMIALGLLRMKQTKKLLKDFNP